MLLLAFEFPLALYPFSIWNQCIDFFLRIGSESLISLTLKEVMNQAMKIVLWPYLKHLD